MSIPFSSRHRDMRACIGFFVLLAAAKVAAQSPTSACADGDEVCQSQSDAPSLLQVRDDRLFAPVASVEAKRRSLLQHTATADQKVAAGKKQREGMFSAKARSWATRNGRSRGALR
mmetsp:Transcript_65950/g.148199  ORF Transcript_65950/g.148199 Transcript_65950/m.148199 type:complete len:116 (+) Transcript_65950:54-401(+)